MEIQKQQFEKITSKNHVIFRNQKEAAEQIIDSFKKGRYTVLVAQTQCGKTGVCQYLCHKIKKFSELNIQQILFICGMNDGGQKNQQISEFARILPEENILFNRDLMKKNQEGKKKNSRYLENTLVIIDESHYGQNKNSQVDNFIKTILGATLDGRYQRWDGKNNYILSVSATPMSELAQLDKKKTVVLKPGDTYYGFDDIMKSGNMHQSFNLGKAIDRLKLSKILLGYYIDQLNNQDFKYILIRFTNTVKAKSNLNKFYQLLTSRKIDFDKEDFHSKKREVNHINENLDIKPKKLTIIQIYNSLRAGFQMNTEHVSMVHETHSADTDVTAQGLPGRCTGYGKRLHNVQIYCNLRDFRPYLEYIESEYDRAKTPSKAKNIARGCKKQMKSHKYLGNVPLIGKIPVDLAYSIIDLKKKHPHYNRPFKELLLDRFKREADFFQIDQWKDYEFSGTFLLDKKIEDSGWDKFWNKIHIAAEAGKIGNYFADTEDRIPSPGYIGGYYLYFNIDPEKAQFAEVIICSRRIIYPKDQEWVETTGKEQFAPNHDPDGAIQRIKKTFAKQIIKSTGMNKKEIDQSKIEKPNETKIVKQKLSQGFKSHKQKETNLDPPKLNITFKKKKNPKEQIQKKIPKEQIQKKLDRMIQDISEIKNDEISLDLLQNQIKLENTTFQKILTILKDDKLITNDTKMNTSSITMILAQMLISQT